MFSALIPDQVLNSCSLLVTSKATNWELVWHSVCRMPHPWACKRLACLLQQLLVYSNTILQASVLGQHEIVWQVPCAQVSCPTPTRCVCMWS